MMVMMNRKSGKHIGALGMPVSLVPQIKELVGNSHFLIFDLRPRANVESKWNLICRTYLF